LKLMRFLKAFFQGHGKLADHLQMLTELLTL